MDLGITGRRAAVAAASAGLGFGAAAALAAEGATVAICGRDDARVREAAERVGRGCVPLVVDVGTAEGGAAFVEQARDALGQIDILVPNAGGPPPGNFASTPVEAYPVALELNLLSTVAMCKAAVPDMQARGWGRVVAITSFSVRQPVPNLILSNTARAGVTGFLKTLAREVARDGVTVNSVQPGTHATDRISQLYGGDLSELAKGIPVGFVGDAADFGQVVAFLCSEHARFVTGVHLPVDGGAVAGLL
jgi:3-oxoacyl-[acyl-carrier protein] reductase